MSIVYLMGGPSKKFGFSESIKKHLKSDCKVNSNITFIASTPDNFSKTDLYVNGDGDSVLGLKSYFEELIELDKICILDNRIDYLEGKNIIANSDIIYLLGGNPLTQIEYLRENGYDLELKKFKGLLIGTSAGAMNLAKDSYYSSDDEYDESFLYDGIGIVDVTIDPHFDLENIKQVQDALKFSYKRSIVGVPNESAIRISDDNIIYINKCYVFNKGIMKIES